MGFLLAIFGGVIVLAGFDTGTPFPSNALRTVAVVMGAVFVLFGVGFEMLDDHLERRADERRREAKIAKIEARPDPRPDPPDLSSPPPLYGTPHAQQDGS